MDHRTSGEKAQTGSGALRRLVRRAVFPRNDEPNVHYDPRPQLKDFQARMCLTQLIASADDLKQLAKVYAVALESETELREVVDAMLQLADRIFLDHAIWPDVAPQNSSIMNSMLWQAANRVSKAVAGLERYHADSTNIVERLREIGAKLEAKYTTPPGVPSPWSTQIR